MGAAKPTKPKEAKEPCTADPGELTTVERSPDKSKSEKPDKLQVKSHKPDKEKKGWIEFTLVDEADRPVAGESYVVTLPNGDEAPGSLDDKGFARVEGFDPGNCKICFPNLDKDAWEPK